MTKTRLGRFPLQHCLVGGLLAFCCGLAVGQSSTASPTWAELSANERLALHPLQAQWNGIDAPRKTKWREIAAKLPSMPRDQQIRMQARMAEWAAMTPAQRSTARLHYETTRQVPTSDKQALWDAYQALPEEQRKALASRAQQRKEVGPIAAASAPPAASIHATQPKTNVVTAGRSEVLPLSIGPSTVQATVGASTRPLTQRPTPPRHQQAGMPKIAATPGFVDRATLLPQRGPQGAAAQPVASAQ